MSKHAISNEKESVGKIFKKFMHVIGINHRLCKWILPCNLGKNIIMAGLPYVGIVYGCDILNALVEQEAKSNIMSMVYQLLGITFVMTFIPFLLMATSSMPSIACKTHSSNSVRSLLQKLMCLVISPT